MNLMDLVASRFSGPDRDYRLASISDGFGALRDNGGGPLQAPAALAALREQQAQAQQQDALRQAAQGMGLMPPEGQEGPQSPPQALAAAGLYREAIAAAGQRNPKGSKELQLFNERQANPEFSAYLDSQKTDVVPSSVQEYTFAQSQGFGGSYQEWITAKAEAGRTQINNNIGGKPPTGYAWDRTDPAAPKLTAIPGGPADKPVQTTEGERANAGYRQRMQSAETILRENYDGGYVAPSWFTRNALGAGVDEGYVMTQQDRGVLQAQRDWVRAKLRKESGAVIAEEEMAEEVRTYFPIHGDGPDVIAQKRASREAADEQMRIGSGRVPGQDTAPPPAQPQGPRKTINGTVYEQRNGVWGKVP